MRICPYVSGVCNSWIHLYNYCFSLCLQLMRRSTTRRLISRRDALRHAEHTRRSFRVATDSRIWHRVSRAATDSTLRVPLSFNLNSPIQVHGWSTRALVVATSWAGHCARVRPPLLRVAAAAAVAATRAARYHCQNQRRSHDAQRMR